MRIFRRKHQVEKAIGYNFQDPSLLKLALTHPSWVDNRNDSNQRLEFLGDAVLEICVSEFLYEKYPDMDEGQLTEHRRKLVQKTYLAKTAQRLGLFKYINLGETEKKLKGMARVSILADTYEALIGAIFLDGGFRRSKRVILGFHLKNVDEAFKSDDARNFKGELLEYAQSNGLHPDYDIVDVTGEKHAQVFHATASINGNVLGTGNGTSKKSAEQMAAKSALDNIREKQIDINNL